MPPDILDRAGPLLADYDVLLCDIWGVLHSGGDVHPEAADALLRFRAKGGTVILVSNAPMAAAAVGKLLDGKKLPRDAWDTIVCSGEIALAHIAVRGYQRLHRIGPQKRDASFFDRLAGSRRSPGQGRRDRLHGPRRRPPGDGGRLPRADAGGPGARRAARVRQSRSGRRGQRHHAAVRRRHRRALRGVGWPGFLGGQAASGRLCRRRGRGEPAAGRGRRARARAGDRRCRAHGPGRRQGGVRRHRRRRAVRDLGHSPRGGHAGRSNHARSPRQAAGREPDARARGDDRYLQW